MQTGMMFDLEFKPTLTPTGVPILTCFRIRDKPYVIDVDGTVYQLRVDGDDPDEWFWIELHRL